MSNWRKYPAKPEIIKDLMWELGYRYVTDFAKDVGCCTQTLYNFWYGKWISERYFNSINDIFLKQGKKKKEWTYYLK